jgi:hypothetical protein
VDPLLTTMGGIVLLLAGSYLWLRHRPKPPAGQEGCHLNSSGRGQPVRTLRVWRASRVGAAAASNPSRARTPRA